MTRVAEQEINENIKKSELKSLWAVVFQTVTILCAIFWGGIKIVEAVKYTVKVEVMAEINEKFYQQKKEQAAIDAVQNDRISDHDVRLIRLESNATNGVKSR